MRFQGEAMSWGGGDQGQVLEVCLERAPLNEIGAVALEELEGLIEVLRGETDLRALIFHSGLARGFCAGADLRALYRGLIERRAAGQEAGTLGEVRRFLDRIHAVFDAIDGLPLTTIAAVHGPCFGGGFELALTCDLIVADRSARFCFPELRLGLIPGWGGVPRLERDAGNAVVRDLLLTGRSMRATRAHEIGLISQVVARGQAVAVARAVAAQACRFDPATAAAAKAFLKPPIEAARLEKEKAVFCERFASPVVEAALRRFVESDDLRPYLPA